ncbi:MAG: ATP synthase F0 subunit C [bacterium]
MDNEAIKFLAKGIAVAFASLGPALALGMTGSKAMEAIGRNPDADAKIRGAMILPLAFAEGIAIISLVVSIII